MKILEDFYKEYHRRPVVIRFKNNKWVEVGTEGNGYYVKLDFRRPLEDFLKKHSNIKVFEASELVTHMSKEIETIGKQRFLSYLTSRFSSHKDPWQKAEDLLKRASEAEPVALVAAISAVVEYRKYHRKYKVPKEIAKKVSQSTTDLLKETADMLIPKSQGTTYPEISRAEKHFPDKWGADERILLYDILFREHRKKPRQYIAVVRGKIQPKLPEDRAIVLSPASVKQATGFDHKTVYKLLNKFPNLTEPVLVKVGTYKDKPVYLKYHLIQPAEKTSASGILVGFPDNPDLEISLYEFTSFALELLKRVDKAGEYSLIEPQLFSRIKRLFPSKTQIIAARLMEQIIAKGSRAFLTLDEIATLLGRHKYRTRGEKRSIIKLTIEILSEMERYGLISSFVQTENGFEVVL